MKERNEHMDQIFRDRLNDYASSSPDHLWEKIDARRSNRKKPSFFYRWRFNLLGVALLLSSLAIGWLIAGQHSKNVSDAFVLALSQNETPNANSTTNTEQVSSLSANSPAILEEVENTEIRSTLPSETSTVSEASIPSNNMEESVSTTAATTTKTIGQTSQQVVITSPPVHRTETIVTLDNQPASSVIAGADQEQSFVDVEDQPVQVVLTNNEQDARPIEEATKIEEAQAPKATDNSEVAYQRLEALFLPKQNEWSEIIRQPHKSLLEFKPRGCYSFKGNRTSYNLFVDVFYSTEKAIRSMSAKNTEYLDYLEAREQTETAFHANSAGVRISMVSQEGFALRSGLVYSQITEEFDYKNENEVRIRVRIEYEIDPFSGDTLSSQEVVTREEGTRLKTTYNKYRMLDIPLILGYEWYFKKFSFDINAGVYFNVLFKQKGDILSPDTYPNLSPVSISSNNPNAQPAFLDKLGFSIYGSVGLNYNLNQDVQLLMEPNFRYQVKSITLEEYVLDQRYVIPGLLVGIRFRI